MHSFFYKRIFLLLLIGTYAFVLQAQNKEDLGRISGDLQLNANFFIRDTVIGAANTPQYDHQLYGADSWLNINYNKGTFDAIVRFDLFNNSNLLNPLGSYNAQGIGRWYMHKHFNKLDVSAGYIYDQIGSGIIFRAYELRPLAIDNALVGIRLGYDITDNIKAKAFTGRQKQQFDLYESVIKGGNIEGYFSVGDSTKPIRLSPGLGVTARTTDDASMNNLVAALGSYRAEDSFVPTYNSYAFTGYNTLSYGNLTWYAEGAYKSPDNMQDPFATRVTSNEDTIVGKFIHKSGSVLYSSLSYAQKGFGLSLEGKRTENFSWRARPQDQLLRGLIGFLPPMARQNTFRLLSRYGTNAQEIGELAYQADIRYAPSRKLAFNVNVSHITDLNNNLLYQELFTEVSLKKSRKWTLLTGLQLQNYNLEVYLFKPDAPLVKAITPYFEYLYKLDRKKALRFEGQYMHTRQDFGSWLFGSVELSLAPHWIITLSDMYNIDPYQSNVEAPSDENGNAIKAHYPRFDVYYTYKTNRFSLSYVKQVEGVVCAGGVCRLEPAFSGVKMTVTSSF